MRMVGGEGTVDEVVQELLVEKRWQDLGQGPLRRRVATLLTGPGFGSSTGWRGHEHKRVVYRMM